MTRRRVGFWVGLSILWIPLAFLFDGVTVLVLPLRVGGDPATLGVVSLVGLGIATGLQPLAGLVSDRLRHRIDRPMFVAFAAVPALLGLWILTGTTTVIAALAGYVVIQLAATSLQAAQQTLIPEHLEPDEQGKASGLRTAFDVGGSFVAFVVLGALLASGDLVLAATVAGAVVVTAVVLVVLFVPRIRPAKRRAEPISQLPAGLAPLIAARFLFLFATYGVGRFLLFLVADRLGLDPGSAVGQAGVLLALFTFTTALAALPIGRVADRHGRRDVMVSGAVIGAVGIGVLVPSAGAAGLLVGGLLMSVGTAAFVTANWAATTALVPSHEAGRLMGIANLGTGLAAAAAGALGLLIDSAGFGPALLVASAASAAAVVPLLTATRIERRTEIAA
jgi:MFS family permease